MVAETNREPPLRPLVIAHRGASAEAPEHTIAAFELAIAHGADGLALTVHLSSDGQPVVVHDPTLTRTTDGSGRVRDRTVRELKRLDAGGWRGPEFRGQRIQTLPEVFERFRDRTRFWIELTSGSDASPDIEERIVSMIEVYDVLDRTLVHAFDPGALDRIRALHPDVKLGVLAARPPFLPLIDSTSGRQAVCPGVDFLTGPDIVGIRQAGLDCYVWTVNEPAQMDRLVEWGVTGIITAHPRLLRARIPPRQGFP
jgi:glycerophosphoryl diester phosphodiesterase